MYNISYFTFVSDRASNLHFTNAEQYFINNITVRFYYQGHSQPYKTVNAKALEDSQVIKLPMRAFQEVFKEYPDIFVRVIQVRNILFVISILLLK